MNRWPFPDKPRLRAFAREPLLHFALFAGCLFAASAALGPSGDVVEVTQAEIEWRIVQLAAQRGSPLDAEERRLAREAYIDERVLVREALALGLEKDERIDDILVQKMLHVLSGDVIRPTEDELATYYAANRARYRQASTVTIDELVVRSGAPLPSPLREGVAPEELSAASVVVHRLMPGISLRDLANLFGEPAAGTLFASEPGRWTVGHVSPQGDHWFRVRERRPERSPPLDEVRDLVRRDWIVEQEEARLARRVQELRERYRVVVEELP